MSTYTMGPPSGCTDSHDVWQLQGCPVYTGIASGRRQSSMPGRLSSMMRKKWTRVEAVREIVQNMCDACVMSLSPRFVNRLSCGIKWTAVPSDVGVPDACGWKLLLNNVYAAEVCGIIEADNSGMGQYVGTHTAKVLFYNRGRAIPANFFLSNTTDKDSAGSMSEFLVGGFGQGELISSLRFGHRFKAHRTHCICHISLRIEGRHRHLDGRRCNALQSDSQHLVFRVFTSITDAV